MSKKPKQNEEDNPVYALNQPAALLVKLGSIIVHFDEASGEGGHEFDWSAACTLLADREVQEWLRAMTKKGLLPVRRRKP